MPHRLFLNIEEVMAQQPFSQAVFLALNGARSFEARSPREALEYLDRHWPAARTAHFRRAQVMCRAAINGMVGSDAARLAVVDAAKRAEVLADGAGSAETDPIQAGRQVAPVGWPTERRPIRHFRTLSRSGRVLGSFDGHA